MERSFIINVGANTKPAQKAFNQLGAQYEELQDGVIKVKMVYDYADKDTIFNALKDLSASNPELLVQINYDMQESLLRQKLKELSSLKELQSALGDSDPAALQNYINSMIDNIESGLKSGVDKSSLSEIFKKAMDLDSLGLEFFGDNWETKATDRLVEVASKLGRGALEYIPDTEKLTDEFENNLATQVENTGKIIDGIKLQLDDLLSKGARPIGGDIDFTDQTESVENFQKTAEDVNDTLAKTNTIKIFDGVSEQIYSVTDDADQLMNKLQELAKIMQTPVFHTGDLSDSLIGSNNEYITDSLGKLLSDGSGLSLGSGKYFTQNLADLIGGWSESGGSFYAFDLSNYTNLLKAETDEQLYELSDMFDAITTLIANAAHDGLSTSTILEQIDAKDAAGVFEYYKDLLSKLGVSSKQFDEFITEQTSWLKSVIDPSQSIDDIYKSLEPYEGFASKFIKTFTGANGFNASNLGTADSSVLGSVIYAFNKKNSPYIDFGENKDIAKQFYELVIDKIISSKALNPENDLKEIVKIFSAEKYKGDARLSDKKINDLHKKLPELEEIQSKQTLETFEELNGEVLSKRSDISEAATQIREKESQVTNAINKKNEELQETSDNLADTDNKINTVAVNSFQQTDEDNEIISASQQISQRETELLDKLHQKEEELEVAEQKIEDTRSVLEDEIARLNSENSRLQDRDLERMTALSANEQLSEESSNLKGRIEELSKSESELLEKVQAKEKELADANAKLNESTGLYDDAVQQIHQLQDENRGLADESDTFLGKIEELQEQLELADERIRENHKFYDEQLGKLQETVDTLTQDNNQLIEDNQYWQSESARKQSIIDDLKANNKDVKGQSIANAFSEKKSDGKISNNESEVFNSIEKAALDAAAAKELFTEDNQKLMTQVGYSVARLESETKAFKDLAEAGLDAAAAKELVTEQNVNLGSIIEEVAPGIKAEAEAFEKMGDASNRSSANNSASEGKRKRGITKTDRRNFEKLQDKIYGNEYLNSLYSSDINKLESEFNSFDKAKDNIDELREHLSKLREEVKSTEGEQNKLASEYGSVSKMASGLFDKITIAQGKNTYTEKFNSHLEDIKSNLKEIIEAESLHDPSQAWDPDALKEYQKIISDIEYKLKGGILNNPDNVYASLGQVDKLLGKINSDMSGSSLSGKLLSDYEELRSELERISLAGAAAGSDVAAITKTDLQGFINQWIKLNSQLKGTGQNVKNFQHQFSTALTNQAAQYLAQFFSFRDLIRYGKQISQTVISTDSALIELRKVSDASNTRIQQSFHKSAETAQELGSTITDVINSTADWARLGYSVDQAEELARVNTLFQTVGDNMTQETASQSLISTMKGFQLDAEQAESIVDKFNEVANHYAIDTEGIGSALQRSAAAFNASHTSLDKSIALVTATNSVLQNPESVGTLWNTMSARLRGAETELADLGEETDEYTQSVSKLQEKVKQMTGFDILEDDGKTYKDLYDIMVGIGKQWDKLSDIDQASLAEALAGKRNSKGLFAVLSNMDDLTGAYETSINSAGSAMREQANYAESVQYSIDRARASMEELANNFLSSELLKGLIETGNTLLQIVNKIVDTLGSIPSVIATLSGIDIAKGLLGNQGVAATLVKGITDAKTGGTADSLVGNILRTIAFNKDAKRAGEAVGQQITEGVSDYVQNSSGLWIPQSAVHNVSNSAQRMGEQAGKSFGSGMKAFLSSPGGIMSIATVIIGATVAIYSSIKKHHDDLIKGAKAAAESWTNSKKNMESYANQVEELRLKLLRNDLAESERVSIKEQIYDIQRKITEEYNYQGGALDLVNGGLKEELGLLQQITVEEAKRNYNEHREEYRQVEKDMARGYYGGIDTLAGTATQYKFGADLSNSVSEAIDSLDLASFEKQLNYNTGGISLVIQPDANMKQISEDTDVLVDRLEGLREEYARVGKTEQATAIDSMIDQVYEMTKRARSDWDDNKSLYTAMLDDIFAKEGGVKYSNALQESIRETNKAVADGDINAVDEAVTKYNKAIDDLKTFGSGIDGFPIQEYIDGMTSSLDEASLKLFDFNDAFKNGINRRDTNQYKKNAAEIKTIGEALQGLGKDRVDIKQLLDSKSLSEEEKNIVSDIKFLMRQLGAEFDGSAEDLAMQDRILNWFTDLGILVGSAEDELRKTSNSFAEFNKDISTTLSSIDAINAAMVNSVSGKGLSIEINAETGEITGDIENIKAAFKDLDNFSPAELFRKTANGVKLNNNQLRKLKAQQDKITRGKFLKQQKDLTKQLTAANRELTEAQLSGKTEDISAAKAQINTLRDQLQQLDYLKTSYEGATSAYQKWLDAQAGGERGDIYDNITSTAVSRADELYKAGLVGTEEFRALAQLMSGQDLSTASVDAVISAYQGFDEKIKGTNFTLRDFFKEGQEGCNAFARALVLTGDASEENGEIIFNSLDTEALAEKYGTSVDIIEAILEKMNDYGAELTWRTKEQQDALDNVSKSYENVKKKIADANFKDWQGIDKNMLDLDSLDTAEELGNAISYVQGLLQNRQSFNINDEQAKALNALLDLMIQKHDIIESWNASDGGLNVPQINAMKEAYANVVSEVQEMLKLQEEHPEMEFVLSNESKQTLDMISELSDEEKSLLLDVEMTPEVRKYLNPFVYGQQKKKEQVTVDAKENRQVNTTTNNTKVNKEITDSETHMTYHVDASEAEYAYQIISMLEDSTPEELATQIVAKVTGIEDINELRTEEEKIAYKKTVDLIAKVFGTKDVNAIQSTLNAINNKSVNLTVTTNASALNQLMQSWSNWRPGTKKLEVLQTVRTTGSVTYNGRDWSSANGTAHAHGTAFAKGHGNWGLKRDEDALINEVGPEMVVLLFFLIAINATAHSDMCKNEYT